MENKKKTEFENPEAIVVVFNDEDIIVTSGPNGGPGQSGDFWPMW